MGWQPSMPGGIDNPHVSAEDRGGIAWQAAPDTSHTYAFRYYDAREHAFLRKFPGATGQGRSELHVKFRLKDGSAGPTYAYFFDSPDAGWEIFRKMQSSPHPYGEVLYPLVGFTKADVIDYYARIAPTMTRAAASPPLSVRWIPSERARPSVRDARTS